MNAQRLVTAALVVALLTVGVLLWQPWADATGAPTAADSPVAADGVEDPDAATGSFPVVESDNEREVGRSERVDVESRDAETPVDPAKSVAVRVIDGLTREPVAGALVYFVRVASLDGDTQRELGRSRGSRERLFEVLSRVGQKRRSNPDGEVLLPRAFGDGGVACRHDGKIGTLRLRGELGPDTVLELHEPRAIRVRVLDIAGQPVPRVPMRLGAQHDGYWRDSWMAETGDDGLATWSDYVFDMGQRTGKVVVALPLPEPASVEVDLAQPPEEPIELTLPPTGVVEVILEHPDPKRLEGARVRLRNFDEPEHGDTRSHAERAAKDGRATFDFVGVGLNLGVMGRLEGGNVTVEIEAPGPVAADQRVTIRVPMVGKTPVLIAELHDERGEPLRSVKLDAQMRASENFSSSSSSFNTSTDADAKIYLELDDGMSAKAERSLQLTHQGDPVRTLKFELPRIHPGEIDVGVLVMRPPPLICAGTVVNADGEPIADAGITLWFKEDAHWEHTDVDRRETDDEGAFTIHGDVQPGAYAVDVSAAGYLPVVRFEFSTGAGELRIMMERAGTVRGRILAGDIGSRRHFRIEAHRHGQDSEEERDPPDTEPGQDGAFAFEELLPGTYDVRYYVFGDPEPVHVESGVRVVAGDETVLNDLDLSGQLHRIEVRVIGIDGRPVREGAAVRLRGGDEQSRFEGGFLDAGRASWIATDERIDVLIYADGYQRKVVNGVKDGDTITLEAGFDVTVQAPAGVVPPTGMRFEAEVRPVAPERAGSNWVQLRSRNRTSTMSGGALPWYRASRTRIDDTGSATVRVPMTGRYSVKWYLARFEEFDRETANLDGTDQVFEVSGSGVSVRGTFTKEHVRTTANGMR